MRQELELQNPTICHSRLVFLASNILNKINQLCTLILRDYRQMSGWDQVSLLWIWCRNNHRSWAQLYRLHFRNFFMLYIVSLERKTVIVFNLYLTTIISLQRSDFCLYSMLHMHQRPAYVPFMWRTDSGGVSKLSKYFSWEENPFWCRQI